MSTPSDQGPTILDLLMDARYPQPSYAAQVAKAIQDKARILATSPYKILGWNVVRRLECLRVIQEELESNNDPQLSNVKAIISAYKRDGMDRLLWTPGPVSFWIQGTPVGDVPGPFSWNACLQLQRRAVGYGGLWIEGSDYAGPIPLREFSVTPPFPAQFSLAIKPPGIPKDQFYGVEFGTQPQASDIPALLSSPVGFPMPRFLGRGYNTTVLISTGVMQHIENLSNADISFGYSVFHCGNEVLKAYRVVILEVALALPNAPSTNWSWTTTRCAICPDLGTNEIRISYFIKNDSMQEELIAWEVEDDAGEQRVRAKLGL
ncbi:uncharacterized protein N7484_008584 [Penicillium longicatenatum]|uniref:uncharacterized protein n=1 Tax=Penicillium longicatenatum TaxID=1561947 RepID=UPI00254931F2|nr:uncharacterized protein N7484_008584 [Penicillium longicatenatum]KAJ5635271.1 hypothetical protein N7484_008584 [Penicillium longicatenatum]